MASDSSAGEAVVGGETTAAASECTIIGEIGINHNGSMDLCKKLIMASKVSGCKYAKIQKVRTRRRSKPTRIPTTWLKFDAA